MAKGSTYMRGLCIVLNILLMIFGVILLLFGIVMYTVKATPAEDWISWVLHGVGFGLVTILLSVLGVYGAYREQVMPLLLYSLFMAIEFTVLMVLTIIALTLTQPQMEKMIEDSFYRMNSTYSKDEVFRRELNKLQKEAECCGLNHYTDWKDEIPSSCFCSPGNLERDAKCAKTTPPNLKSTSPSPSTEFYVYSKQCGPILIEYMKKGWRILLGILFTLATIEVAAVVTALMLCYKIHKRSPGTCLSEDDHSRTKYELKPDEMP